MVIWNILYLVAAVDSVSIIHLRCSIYSTVWFRLLFYLAFIFRFTFLRRISFNEKYKKKVYICAHVQFSSVIINSYFTEKYNYSEILLKSAMIYPKIITSTSPIRQE